MKLIKILKDDLNQPLLKNLEMNQETVHKLGLTSEQAKNKLNQEGPNILKEQSKTNAILIFANQFKDILVFILIASTVVSAFMGEFVEAITICAIIFINAILGFFQELKTEKALEALKNMSAPMAKAYRDNKLLKILSSEVVTDDIILIEAGDKVPADAVLIEESGLAAEESILTGESVPSLKKVSDTSTNVTNKLNQSNIIYMGTVITQGHAKARVIATGMKSQMGQIANMINNIPEEPTPLQQKLAHLGKYIAFACLIICIIVTIAGIIGGQNMIDMLITGVSLAVAAIPEGLPAIVTIALALSVKRMIKKKSLIRKLHAVETLGCTTIICSDKTGTLTQNKMTAKQIITYDNIINVSGNGYEKSGDFTINNNRINIMKIDVSEKLLKACVLCNNANITSDTKAFEGRDRTNNKSKGNWEICGDPTEVSLLVMAAKSGMTNQSLEKDYIRINETPFNSKNKYMSVIVKKDNKKFEFVKGAYDIILKNCTYILSESGLISIDNKICNKINQDNESMTNQALRVLGVAYRELDDNTNLKNMENLIFLGLIGIIDPPRKEAKQAVKSCCKAGIKTVMITGDHKNTAKSIAAEIGIFKPNHTVLTGNEMEQLTDEELKPKLKSTSVFARVSPSDKVRIVRLFKSLGHIVAMTGDGVNDAPAVKEANIGVSMGINGTDVTKEASDVVLLDDNFATLIHAVEEGRVIYSNIRKFIRYLLACNIGEVITMFLSIIMGMPIILLPIQILLVNLVTDGLPAIALGLEPAEKGVMLQKPRGVNKGIFSDNLLSTIIFRGCLIGISTVAVFVCLFKYYHDLDIARTGALLCLVISQLIHAFECKSESKNLFTIHYFNNLKLLFSVLISGLIVILTVYSPVMQTIFKTVYIDFNQFLIILFYSLIFPVLKAIIDFISDRFKKIKISKNIE